MCWLGPGSGFYLPRPRNPRIAGFPGPILATHLKIHGQRIHHWTLNITSWFTRGSPISQRFAGETFDQFRSNPKSSPKPSECSDFCTAQPITKRYVWTLIIGILNTENPNLSCWDLGAQIDPYASLTFWFQSIKMAGIKFEFSCGPSAELSLMPSGQRCAMFFSQVTSSEAILCEPIGPKTS